MIPHRMSWVFVALISLSMTGCALFRPKSASNALAVVVTPENDSASALVKTEPEVNREEFATSGEGILDRNDLQSYDKVSIRIPHADLIVTGTHPRKKGKLSVKRLAGDPTCKAYLVETENSLLISDAPMQRPGPALGSGLSAVGKGKSVIPQLPSCYFGIELSLSEAAELDVEMKKGTLFVENWDEPIRVKLGWGDIDVGQVGDLSAECGHCTLAGENLSGILHYNFETGNIGLSGLSDSVDGQTSGDTILKWRKLGPKANVKLASRAGDVLLFFPGAVPINADLKAPHGEVRDGQDKDGVRAHFHSGPGGVPVSVTAELGNVRLYRAGTKDGI